MYRHGHDGESDTKKCIVMAMMKNPTQKKVPQTILRQISTRKKVPQTILRQILTRKKMPQTTLR